MFAYWLESRWASCTESVLDVVLLADFWASLLLEVVVGLVGQVGEDLEVVGSADVEDVPLLGEGSVGAGGHDVVRLVLAEGRVLKRRRFG